MLLGIAGCVGTDETEDEPTKTETPPPSLQVDDRGLSSAFPMVLVKPDADVGNINRHVTGDSLIVNVQFHEPQNGGSHWHFSPLNVALNDTAIRDSPAVRPVRCSSLD